MRVFFETFYKAFTWLMVRALSMVDIIVVIASGSFGGRRQLMDTEQLSV